MYLWYVLVSVKGWNLHGELKNYSLGWNEVTPGNEFFPEVSHLASSSLQLHPVPQQKSIVPRTKKHQVKSGLAKAPQGIQNQCLPDMFGTRYDTDLLMHHLPPLK